MERIKLNGIVVEYEKEEIVDTGLDFGCVFYDNEARAYANAMQVNGIPACYSYAPNRGFGCNWRINYVDNNKVLHIITGCVL